MATTRAVRAGLAFEIAEACESRLGVRPEITGEPHRGDPVLLFAVDLTAGQEVILDRIIAAFRSHSPNITPEEWQALEGAIATMRTARIRTDAQWAALTAAQRDSQLIAWNRGITDVLRALLRD